MSKNVGIFLVIINLILLLILGFLVFRLGGVKYLLYKVRNSRIETHYLLRADQLDKLSQGQEKVDILLIGDSMIEYGMWTDWWPKWSVANKGIAGDVLPRLIARLNVALKTPSDIMLVLIGINDLYYNDAKSVIVNFNSLLKKLAPENENRRIIIHEIFHVNNGIRNTGIDNEGIINLNKALKTECERMGFEYMEIPTFLFDKQNNLKEELTYDGLHLNGSGYKMWSEYLKMRIQSQSNDF